MANQSFIEKCYLFILKPFPACCLQASIKGLKNKMLGTGAHDPVTH